MKNILFSCFLTLFCMSEYAQTFEIEYITSGDYDARNPFISFYSFSTGRVYFEKHLSGSSNIYVIEYDPAGNSFQDTIALTQNHAMNINAYEDFNSGLLFQTNQRGNWDIAYRAFDGINWEPVTYLTNSPEDEFNLSPFYTNEIGYPNDNYTLFQRSDTIIVMDYSGTTRTEYPVLINTTSYQYSDYIGVQYFNPWGNYPRPGIHVIAVEMDSTGNKNLISKYKPFSGDWESINIIKEHCDCSNLIIQNYGYIPNLIFDDSTSSGIKPFYLFDWEQEKNIQEIPVEAEGNVFNFRIDRPHIITESSPGNFQIGPFPHSYFVSDSTNLKIRLNKEETGTETTDTLINVKYDDSKMVLSSLGVYWGEYFYTIWEDSLNGHIHLLGRFHNYPISDVDDKAILSRYYLNQNYPNPFNPATTIKYEIPERSKVVLKLYDVLGNEVATLVNEELSAGEYEVEFNSSAIEHDPSSGIYFYQLKAGSFIQTKKMVLLK